MGKTSGVISRIAKPVPPEVMTRFNFSVSAHCFICDCIAEISSGTILTEETDQIFGNSAKTSRKVGPDRSVDISREAVSLTLQNVRLNW